MNKELYEEIKKDLTLHWEAGETDDKVFRIVVEKYPQAYKGFIWCMLQILRAHSKTFRY